MSPNLPRLAMHYEVEVHGLRRRVELPFVTVVVADLSGMPDEPLPPVAERALSAIDLASVDACLAAAQPRVAFSVPNTLTGDGQMAVDLRFACLDDFAPERVLQQIDALRMLVEAREALVVAPPGAAPPAPSMDPPPPPLPPAPAGPALTMAETMRLALAGLPVPAPPPPPPPPLQTPAMTAATLSALDRKVDEQLNLVMHHPLLQRLEATWRGLHHLVRHSETGDELQIRVLNLSKADLARTLRRYRGSHWDQSPLFDRLVADGLGTAGGDPVGCVVMDHAFDHSPPDVEMLRELARIGAAMHAPIVAAAAPALMQMETWRELSNPRDLAKIFQTAEYAAWRSLREAEDARHLVLTLPHFLARAPHGSSAADAAPYRFQEDLGAVAHHTGVWASSAYLLALNLHRAFSMHGWCTRIRGLQGGGAVDDLPAAAPPLCPAEVEIPDRRAAELAHAGLAPLVWRAGAGLAVFQHTPTLHCPAEYDDPQAGANARCAAELPHQMAISRVMHYMRAMLRDELDGNIDRAVIQAAIEHWLADYTDPDAGSPGAFATAARPFAAAVVVVEEVAASPGVFKLRLQARPNL